MTGNNKQRGSNAERKLANRLTDEGWLCMRSAGSGSAQRAQPDLTAMNENAILLIECKTYEDPDHPIPIDSDRAQLDEARGMVEDWDGDMSGRRDLVAMIAMRRVGGMAWKYVEPIHSTVIPSKVDQKLYNLLSQYKP